jgi:hypothetical protein
MPYWCLVLDPLDPNHDGVDVGRDGAQWGRVVGSVLRDPQLGLPGGRPVRWVLAGGRGLVVASVDGRGIDVGGEWMLNGDLDYVRYAIRRGVARR